MRGGNVVRRLRIMSPPDDRTKLVPVSIIHEINRWVFFQGPQDSCSKTAIRYDFRCIGGQDRIANVRVAASDVRNGEIVWKVARTNDLHSVIKHEDSNGC